MRYIAIMLAFGMCALGLAAPAVAVEMRSAIFRIDYPRLAPISRFEVVPDDLGFAGAILATEDNMTTGSFLGHTYEVETVSAPPEEADAAFQALLDAGHEVIVVLAEGEDLLRLSDMAGEGALIMNASAQGVALRDAECRANTLHIAPSDAMKADAVAQFAVWKKWPEWLLIHGSNPADLALAEAYRRAAAKFGAQIVEERAFEDTGGARRTDSGHVLVQRQIPLATQGAEAHDIVIAADASDYFAPYLPFHLWTPAPVMGSAGLRPVTFHGAQEAWGATQFQNRFEEIAGRYMREEDYQTWLALRIIGEAVTRANTGEVAALRDYLLSEDFEVAAFKGVPVTFRPWNGQLRQPILLFDGRITASVSPQEGFLHQVSPLDTLGLDRSESACTEFGGRP